MTLKEIRLARGYSQRGLAAIMFPGRAKRISAVNICQVERGTRQPWPGFKKEAARVLNVTEAELWPESEEND